MNRRHALRSLIALGVSTSVTKAQPANKVWRIGYLSAASGPDELLDGAFVQELRSLGYIEGRKVQIEYRWAGGNNQRHRHLDSRSRCRCRQMRRFNNQRASPASYPR